MHIVDLILKKRNGGVLETAEINYLIKEYTNDNITDYQMSALLMAIYFRGMNDKEALDLSIAMRDSGDVFDLSAIDGIKVDKHSTGGVGDRSEEHTSELQSRPHLVCRLLLEKKKKKQIYI